jgi:hypothetical protein
MAAMTLDLETRTGWPDDLRILIERYPRDVWMDHVNLGELARFWLDIHDGFRSFARSLQGSGGDFREGLILPEEFRRKFAPRLQTFLSHLNGHHQIEDYQFFPVFSVAEPRLVKGFEVLEADHEVIHRAMDKMVETANNFMQIPAGDWDKMRVAGDDYATVSEGLIKLLGRHLEDEEDLIIPLILDRTEGALGIG